MERTERRGPENTKEGTDLRCSCTECSGETHHRVVRSAEYSERWESGDFSIEGWNEYQVVECAGCEAVSFRHTSRNTEDVDPQEGFRETVRMYPSREETRSKIRGSRILPPATNRVYTETLQALDSGMPVLAGVGLRAMVETICKDKNASGGSLEKRIDSLKEARVLTDDGAEILHSLRILGNQAAHEVTPHDLEDLEVALEVVEHALRGMYILPKRAEKLPKRRP